MSSSRAALVLTTVEDQEQASTLAEALVAEQLAACVNILGPVQSVYQWEGAIQKDAEFKLFIKTFAEHFDQLRARILELHSYDVPEISMIAIEALHPDYFSWMQEHITSSS